MFRFIFDALPNFCNFANSKIEIESKNIKLNIMNIRRILVLVAAFVMAVMPSVAQEKKNIELADIYGRGTFYPEMFYSEVSQSDGKVYYVVDNDENGTKVNKYSYKSGAFVNTLFSFSELIPDGYNDPIRVNSYTMSADETKALFATETRSIYRHSSESYYYVYDLKTKSLTPVSKKGKQRLATFSPDATKVAFVRNNNIYIKDLKADREYAITSDGVQNQIINGAPDWVYEEEFGFAQGFYWSPDSKKIAFYRFDESNVKEFHMDMFQSLYPELEVFKYPKAGEDNSVVSIHVYNLEKQKSVEMHIGTETDIYIPRIKWTADNNTLAIQRLNRHQNHLEILLANANTGHSEVAYDETNPYYIEITDDWTFLADKKTMIMTSEKDGYNHIYLYDLKGNQLAQLTSGNWDVTRVYGYDAKRKVVFYQSAEKSPLQRQIYSVNLNGKRKCIVSTDGTNEAEFSTDYTYFINTNTAANRPHNYSVYQYDGKKVRTLVDNAAFAKKMEGFNLSKKEFFQISGEQFAVDGKAATLDCYRILPPDFDANKKYPVLLHIYGGPGHQTVTDDWGWSDYFWEEMLAEKGIIVVSINNRGSGAQGQEFKKMTYLQLGKYETEDMINFAKYLGNLPYVDSNRIAVFGWSYGGFMATSCIAKGADVFSTAVAVAPVTNWRYYDNIYTERYMRTPQENADGYDQNSPINHVEKIKGNYLLVHGSADDNVHFQNSMELVTALIKANVQFDMMVYPNKNHSIYGGNTRYHLFTKITNFLEEHLLGE